VGASLLLRAPTALLSAPSLMDVALLLAAFMALSIALFAVSSKTVSEPAALLQARKMCPSWVEDMAINTEIMRKGSKSFFMASKLLPVWMREPTLALYGYCRHGDDEVDDVGSNMDSLKRLHVRLDQAYDPAVNIETLGTPVERTFAAVVRAFEIPRELPLALLEGFQWDLVDAVERYETVEDTIAYAVRVASAVGGMMVALMPKETRRPEVMARAYDLGIAMQLTNISRDVGEDARIGRVYIPHKWIKEEGVDRAELLKDPKMSPGLGRVTKRLLDTADVYYKRADAGIKFLPLDCQLAVQAASVIYSDIGRIVRANNYDNVNTRAHTSKVRKLYLVLVAFWRKTWCSFVRCDAPAAESAQYLVHAICPTAIAIDTSERNAITASWLQTAAAAAVSMISTDKVLTSTEHAAEAPLFEAPHVPREQYLRKARSNADKWGAAIAALILGSWALLVGYSMQLNLGSMDQSRATAPLWLCATLFVCITWLYTGMFITAHDAMHGLVCPRNRWLNNMIGAGCVHMFALFDYKLLMRAHWAHHRHPAEPGLDPDYHDGTEEGSGFWAWYAHFMLDYMTWSQLGRITFVFNFVAFGLTPVFGSIGLSNIPVPNIMCFWVVPSLLSSLQLFYFGTYLPHKVPEGSKDGKWENNAHRSSSTDLPDWASLLACFHFGLHLEHHTHPYMPWWQLPNVRIPKDDAIAMDTRSSSSSSSGCGVEKPQRIQSLKVGDHPATPIARSTRM
jgi:phytoene synthase